MSRAVSTVHVFLHVAEICLQMEAAVKYLDVDRNWCYVILSITLGPLVLSNLISIIWVFQNMDFSNKRCGKTVCIILHTLQLGMVWRYFKLILLYEDHDYDEYIVLRVIQALLLSGPYLVIQSYLFFQYNYSPLLATCVTIALLSLTFAFSSYIEGNIREVENPPKPKPPPKKDIEGKPEKEVKEGDKVPMFKIILVQFLWRFSVLSSRMTAVVLFTVAMGYWIFLVTGIHTILIYSWSMRKECREEKRTCTDRVLSLIAAYAQTFDLLNLRENENPSIISAYYLLVVVENSIFTVMALTRVKYLTTPNRKLMILSIVYGAFLIGIVFLIIYNKCVCEKKHKKVPCHFRTACCRHRRLKHGDQDHFDVMFDDFTWDDYDGDIPGKDDGYVNPAFEASVSSQSINSSRHNSIMLRHCNHTFNNRAYCGHPKYCQTSFNRPRVHTPTRKCSNSSPASSISSRRNRQGKLPITPEKRLGIRNVKNTSLSTRGSSNSRNTNTLDLSIHSGQQSVPCSDCEMPSCSQLTKPRSPAKDLRGTPTKQRMFASDELFYICPSPTRIQQGQRLSAVSLGHCSYDIKPDLVSDKDAKIVFRQTTPLHSRAPREKHRDSTSRSPGMKGQGSLSDRDSDSDWMTCSDTDSEYAQTWPPSNPPATSQSEQLPPSDISTVDHVAMWIKKTSSFLPTHAKGRPIDDIDVGKLRSRGESSEHKHGVNKITRFFRAASLPRSKEALMKFCSLRTPKKEAPVPKSDEESPSTEKPDQTLKPSVTVSTNMDIIEVLSEESIV